MKLLTCAAVRRRLEAFHDDELAVTEQIAVGSHIEWCGECAGAFADLRVVRAALRSRRSGLSALSQEELVSFQSTVVGRARAERAQSPSARLDALFDDMHFVYAG